MQTNLQLVPIGAIEVLHNYREVHPPTEKDPDIIELSQDIKVNGLYQAIMLRPHPSKKEIYQIIFGHRRFIAAKLAGLATIPANIKAVPDDQVLEIQVTENLQRKDCHPMDEAVAYKQLMENKKYSTADICARFSKKDDYILQRLKLNDLAPALQNDFKLNKMTLGIALLLCRLTHTDQLTVKKAYANDLSAASIPSVKDYITRRIIHDLGNAPWKQTDADLLPAAGPCNTCPKRSGYGNLLFKDMAKDNRCMDAVCFDKKMEFAFAKNLKDVIETQPEVHIVQLEKNNRLSAEITTLLKDMNVKVLYDGKDCHSYSTIGFSAKSKGFYLDSVRKGKIDYIYISGKSTNDDKKNGSSVNVDIKAAIEGIKQRTTRSAELDAEKVHARILEDLKKHATQKEVDAKMKAIPEPEAVAMAYIIFELLGYSEQKEVAAKLKLKGFDTYNSDVKKSVSFYQSLRDISTGELALIIRKVMLSRHPGTTMHSNKGYIIRKMAESYKDIAVATFEADQKAIRDKREKNAAARIAALQPVKAAKKAAPKKAAKKKVVKKKK